MATKKKIGPKIVRDENEKLLAFINRKYFGKRKVINFISKTFIYILLFSISYVFLYPLLKIITMTFMPQGDIINPEVTWLPKNPSFSNLKVAFRVLGMPGTFFNSLWFTGSLAIIQTAIAALTGFAFARYNFKFKNFWFIMLLFSFIIPLPVVIIPRIMMFVSVQSITGLNIIGTIIPQFVMTLFGQGVFAPILVLIFYNFFRMIPKALDEAAKIDGATAFQVFWNVIIKLSAPTIITVFLFSFVWNWNESYQTSTFVRGSIKLLPMQLLAFDSIFGSAGMNVPKESGQALINEAYKMAATLITVIPVLVLYTFVQKQFIEGIENTGIK